MVPSAQSLSFWDVANGNPLPPYFKSHEMPVRNVFYTPDGKRILSAGEDGLLLCWDAGSGKQVYEQSPGTTIGAMALSRSGAIFATGGYAGDISRSAVQLWKTKNGVRVRDLEIRAGNVPSLAFSDDSRLLALAVAPGGNYSEIGIWDVAMGRLLVNLQTERGGLMLLRGMAFSADAKVLYTVDQSRPFLKAWDAASGKQRKGDVAGPTAAGGDGGENLATARFWGHAFTPDVTRLVTCDGNVLKVWELATGRRLSQISLPGEEYGGNLAISRDGRLLAAGRLLFTGHVGASVVSLCTIDPKTGSLSLVDSGVKRAKAMQDSEDGDATSLAFSPDNTRLVMGTDRGTTVVWDISAKTAH